MSDPRLTLGGQGPMPAWASTVPPQARAIQGQRAGFITRFIAAAIDFALVGVVLGLLYLLWAVLLFAVDPTGFSAPDLPYGVVLIAGGVTAWTYFAISWGTTGRTWGSRVMGIRVVNFQGRVMKPGGAAVRAAFCLAFLPGLFWAIVSSENRSLQDTVLRTSVIHDWTRRPPQREKSTT